MLQLFLILYFLSFVEFQSAFFYVVFIFWANLSLWPDVSYKGCSYIKKTCNLHFGPRKGYGIGSVLRRI